MLEYDEKRKYMRMDTHCKMTYKFPQAKQSHDATCLARALSTALHLKNVVQYCQVDLGAFYRAGLASLRPSGPSLRNLVRNAG